MKSNTCARLTVNLVLAGSAMLCAVPAFAQTQRSYAVLSLIGDKIGVVMRQTSTGSSLSRNQLQELEVPDDTFDADAARAASDAIKRENPGVVTTLYSSRDPKLFALQDKLVDLDAPSTELTESMRDLLAQSNATHLLLITKHRGEARLKLVDGYVGDGQLRGIGFYIDPAFHLTNVNSGKSGRGMFAAYAYLKITVFDAKTLQAVNQWVTTESRVYGTNASDTAIVPWDALTAVQKANALSSVVKRAVTDAVPRVTTVR